MTPETAIELLDRMHASPDRLNDADKNIVANLRSTHRTSEVSIADDIESGSVWFIHTFLHRKKHWRRPRLTRRAARFLVVFIALVLITLVLLGNTGALNGRFVCGFVAVPMLIAAIVVSQAIQSRRNSVYGKPRGIKRADCRGCGYDLRGLDDAIVFPSGLEDPPSSGPEHCPECGRRWPLLA